ncbi:MAG: metallophosphoesterase [Planctomycetales bacterium]|nr:metallophosphoesterase [Planctomycetales bacterium]
MIAPIITGLFLLIGHFSVCTWIVNRLHATALPYRFLKKVDKVWYLFLFGAPIATVAWWIFRPTHPVLQADRLLPIAIPYAVICAASAIIAIPVWIRYLMQLTITERLVSNHTKVVKIDAEIGFRPIGSPMTRFLTSLPMNQVFQLAVHEKALRMPRLNPALDGLSIAHLSDLHLTGTLTEPFFEQIVERTNQLDADIVVITGDIIDKPYCMSWLNTCLAGLKSRNGVYFILGNHDLRVKNELGVRNALMQNGYFDLGGRSKLIEINGQPIFLGGNELPWFCKATDMSECPSEVNGKRPFQIILSHSPDQVYWAQRHDVDLLLAGHTHGGQIRFPVIGPVFAPSRFGVKYASGTFFEEPTLMHVSRGISGTRHLRFNCRPELAKLVLQCERNRS